MCLCKYIRLKYELKNKSIFYDCSNLFHIFAATKYILLPCK